MPTNMLAILLFYVYMTHYSLGTLMKWSISFVRSGSKGVLSTPKPLKGVNAFIL